jgi:FkbM family methyltransferase
VLGIAWSRLVAFAWAMWQIRGLEGRLRVAAMKLGRLVRREPDPEPIELGIRALRGGSLWVRPGTSDLDMAFFNLHGRIVYPPGELEGRSLNQIVELGSNGGSGLAALAVAYPEARLIGVEPDPETAAIARRNAAQFGDRCTLVQAGIWDESAELVVEGDEALGYTVRPREPGEPVGKPVIRGVSVDDLLAEHMPDGPIDYMAVTIEGTEPRMLATAASWIDRVRCIKVEFHPYYGFTEQDCVAALREFGFRTWVDPRYGGWGVGIRD